jgi:hypothetical protein
MKKALSLIPLVSSAAIALAACSTPGPTVLGQSSRPKNDTALAEPPLLSLGPCHVPDMTPHRKGTTT